MNHIMFEISIPSLMGLIESLREDWNNTNCSDELIESRLSLAETVLYIRQRAPSCTLESIIFQTAAALHEMRVDPASIEWEPMPLGVDSLQEHETAVEGDDDGHA